jgi:four helix bundle protein
MHNFKELKVWQKSIDLAVEVYKATSLLPNEERFGLISQMKRCSVSIPSNIAEGCPIE